MLLQILVDITNYDVLTNYVVTACFIKHSFAYSINHETKSTLLIVQIKLLVNSIYQKSKTVTSSVTFEQIFTSSNRHTRRIAMLTEAVFRKCSVKMMLLEISQNSQENTCASVSEIELQALVATSASIDHVLTNSSRKISQE